jgi:hypothetical protein
VSERDGRLIRHARLDNLACRLPRPSLVSPDASQVHCKYPVLWAYFIP